MGHDLRTGLNEGDVNVKDVEEREEEADTNDPNEQVGERPDGDTVLARDHGSAAARYARDGGGEAARFGCHEMLAPYRIAATSVTVWSVTVKCPRQSVSPASVACTHIAGISCTPRR